jgi:hypothetical protein
MAGKPDRQAQRLCHVGGIRHVQGGSMGDCCIPENLTHCSDRPTGERSVKHREVNMSRQALKKGYFRNFKEI